MSSAKHAPPLSLRSGSSALSWRFAGLFLAQAALLLVMACGGGGGGAPAIVNAAPLITTQPASQIVKAGSAATFTVAASGTPTPTFTWQRSNDSGTTWTAITGATSATYTFTVAKADTAAQFRAVATNAVSPDATSTAATLTVQWLTITTQPANANVNAGSTATFSVVADASPAATYQWQSSPDDGTTWTIVASATSASYTTAATSVSNSGTQYRCVLTNATGTLNSSAATLTVTAVPAPVITSFVAAKSPVTSGTATTLTAVFTGGTGSVSNSVGAVTTGTAVSTGNLTATTTYTLTVTNAANVSVTQTVTVTVVAAPAITSFTATKATITTGTSTTLTGVFTGGTGAVNQSIGTVTSGTAASTGNLTATTTYTLTVTNAAGTSVTQTATVTVVAAPAITSFTAAAPTITTGTSTTLTGVFTGGTGSVDHSIGTVTSGTAASTGNLTATTTYTLTVTNAAGTSVTLPVTVTVVAAPAITSFTAAAPSITSGTSTTLTGVFTGGTGSVDHSVGTVTSGTAASTGNLTANTTFTLTVTNAAGTSVTLPVTVTIVAAPVITSFTAASPVITNGTATILSYTFTGGTGAIDQTVGTVTSGGTSNVHPTVTTTYTLTVTNGLGATTTQTATVTVVAAPVITSFTAAAPTINPGTSTTLTGVFTGGTGTVNQGIGAVTTGVAKTTGTLTATTTFTLTVSNAATTPATATLTATVTVGGTLTVTITGLGSLPANVTVTGPGSFSQALTATQTFSGLTAGSYTVTAATITDTTQPGLGGSLGPAHLQRYPTMLTYPAAAVSLGATSTVTVNYPPATLNVAAGSTSIALVLMPPGSFSMGEAPVVVSTGNDSFDAPVHTVTVGKAFYMAKYLCTQAQWVALMGSNPSVFTADDPSPLPAGNGLQRPVDSVDFTAITMPTSGFMDVLNAAASASLASQLGGGTFSLPTEVEYEYALRAGTTSNYYFGAFTNPLDGSTEQATVDSYCWNWDNDGAGAYPLAINDPGPPWINPLGNLYASGYPGGSPQRVGQLPPNPWGLYDIIGNIWEACQDNWHASYTGAPTTDLAWVDPPSPANYQHVYRGGSWGEPNTYGQSRIRGPYPSTNVPETSANWAESFRVVLQLP